MRQGAQWLLVRLALCVMPALLIVSLSLPVGAAPSGARNAYLFCIDEMAGQHDGSRRDQMLIDRDRSFSQGQRLHFAGWIAAPDGISGYEYTFVPLGHGDSQTDLGSPDWYSPDEVRITARRDLAAAGVPYPSGYATAGFDLTLSAPEGTDGYYDFYLRAVDADGNTYDLLAVLNVAVGLPDADNGSVHRINLARLARDGGEQEGISFPKAGGIRLSAGGILSLGRLSVTPFESVRITYTVSFGFTENEGTQQAALGLKIGEGTGMPNPYNRDGKYDMSGSLTMGRLREGTETRSLQLDLSGIRTQGELYLSAYLFGSDRVTVTELTFVYSGKGTSRTAARIFFSGDLAPYLSGANSVDTETVHDSRLGDVLRIRASSETNDPYVYFNAESLLAQHEIRVNADEYRYIVVLARARKGNAHGNMTFYLCAGDIGGPTEACTITQTLETDGMWHYYLLDLSDLDTWAGLVHGWRFDMINAPAAAGDYVDYASVQFFRTEEAAWEVASGNPLRPDVVFRSGDAPVMRDDREEAAEDSREFVPDEGDVYEPFETVTDTESAIDATVTDPSGDESATEPTGGISSETDAAGGGRGCRSSVNAEIGVVLAWICLIGWSLIGMHGQTAEKQSIR